MVASSLISSAALLKAHRFRGLTGFDCLSTDARLGSSLSLSQARVGSSVITASRSIFRAKEKTVKCREANNT